MILGQVAGLPMFISYASVFIAMMIIGMSVLVMGSERKRCGDGDVLEKEFIEEIAYLTVTKDERSDGKKERLKNKVYHIGEAETIGSHREADTVINHPAVCSEHVQLTYHYPGKMIVEPMNGGKVATTGTNSKQIMDGDSLVLSSSDGDRIELQLNFIKAVDINAAKKRSS